MKLEYIGADDHVGSNFIAKTGDFVEFPLEIALQKIATGLWKEVKKDGNGRKGGRGIYSKASSNGNDNRGNHGECGENPISDNGFNETEH